MTKGELSERLRMMKFQFQLQRGTVPNAILVPVSRIDLFVAGCVVDMDAMVDPKLLKHSIETDAGDLVIHDMIVRPSKVVDDLTVCIHDS